MVRTRSRDQYSLPLQHCYLHSSIRTFFERVWRKMFGMLLGDMVTKVCTSPRNSTWTFLLMRGWDLGMRLDTGWYIYLLVFGPICVYTSQRKWTSCVAVLPLWQLSSYSSTRLTEHVHNVMWFKTSRLVCFGMQIRYSGTTVNPQVHTVVNP